MHGKLVHELELLVWVRVWGWVRVMVEFGTSSAFRGWVRVRVLGYGFGVRGIKVKSRDCALASDLVRAVDLPTSLPGPDLATLLPRLSDLLSTSYLLHFSDLLTSLPRLSDLTSPTYRPHFPDLAISLPRFSVLTSPTYRPHFPDLATSLPRHNDCTSPT